MVGPSITGGMLGPGVGVGLRKEDADLEEAVRRRDRCSHQGWHGQEALGEMVQGRHHADELRQSRGMTGVRLDAAPSSFMWSVRCLAAEKRQQTPLIRQEWHLRGGNFAC